ncbi:phage tail spike protein [Streptococcus thermophilus]|uniref:phage tail spike protein n=1 Tax=Streptococcus thermophilus TaxID=1308 RepID=UPI001C64ACD2|nr:phage tail spike protein [Streptococcus thermophilus]MBW7802641.1 phage tail protein [Streptococcus thermophilus]
MLLTIHDANLQKVGFIDNEKQETLNFYDDTWNRNLETASSVFEFTVSKKELLSDTGNKHLYNQLNERSFVSFKYKGKTYLFNIMKTEENERWLRCYCENLNLELINEYANPYKADRPLSFAEYLDVFEIPQFAMVTLGINEISDQKRTLEWEGQETKLARLLSLANKFDAEVEFVTRLNDDSSINQLILNVYHKADDSHTGVGRIRGDIRLTFEKNIKSMTRKVDKTEIYTLVVPYGKSKETHEGEQEVRVYIDSLPPWEEKNDEGIVIFKQEGVNLYAPHAANLYPSTFGAATQDNKWIRKDLEVDSDDPKVIRAAGIANLRKHAYPAITYEVDGFVDVEIGDTITIHDKGFTPALDIRARAVEQKISFSNPINNKTTFGNFKELENRTSGDLRSVFEQMVENSRPYNIMVATDNGVLFKNYTGQSTIRPTLKRGNQVVNATYRFVINGSIVSSGLTYTVKASDITKPTVITISAWVDDKEVASEEVTFLNVSDGKQGPKGDDGKTTYFHTAWSYSADGTDRFSTVYPNLNLLVNSSAKTKDGFFKDFDKVENGYGEVTLTGTNTWVVRNMWDGFSMKPRDYKPGDKYTMSMDVMFTSWNLPAGTHLDEFWIGQRYTHGGGLYSWKRICFIELPKDPSKMLNQWIKITQTSTIPPYEDPAINTEAIFMTKFTGPSEGSFTIRIRNPKQEQGEIATPYMPSASEATTADYPSFIGHYTDYTQVDSPNPRDYTWSLIRGNDGKDGANGGENLIVNSAFPEDIDGWGFWDESTPNNNLHIATHGFYYNGTKPLFRLNNNTNGVVPASTKRFPVKRNTDYSLNIQIFATGNLKSVDIYFLGRKANETDKELTKVIHLKTHTGSPSTTQTVKWHLTFNSGDCDEGFIRILNNGTTDGNTSMLFFAELDCYEGTGDRAWQASSKDLEEEIDTKADDVLTQAQLNRLNETNSIIKAELDAKASLDKLNQWVEAYQDFVNSNNANRAQAEKNLADASARVTKLENDLNDMSERWNFIDSYMTASNEGLVVGKKDNSSSIMFNPNGRISMFSAGHEVMYISQGVIHIENGIFSKTIQIGRYREEQDLLNPDRNVIRYVGGA